MTYAYSHRPDGDFQGEFGTAKQAAEAATAALADFLQDADEKVFYVGEAESRPLSYYAPTLVELVGGMVERIAGDAGDLGDEAVSWLEENIGAIAGDASPGRIEVEADLSTNLVGLINWWAEKHEAPRIRRLVGKPAVAYLTRPGEWAWRDTAG